MINPSFLKEQNILVTMDNQLELTANNKPVIGKVDGGLFRNFSNKKNWLYVRLNEMIIEAFKSKASLVKISDLYFSACLANERGRKPTKRCSTRAPHDLLRLRGSQIHSTFREIGTIFFLPSAISGYTWAPPIPTLLEVAAALPVSISNRVRIRAL